MIDLTSDTKTLPTNDMKRFMMSAPLGDDIFKEDPTVNKLEETVADLFQKDNALFMPSATQSNLSAILSHCERGDEYITGDYYHCYRWEAGGAAVVGSIQPQPLPVQLDGTISLKDIESHIKPNDPHFAKTKLLALENTHQGKVIDQTYFEETLALAQKHHLKLHLDGARLFNASTRLNIPVNKLASPFNTITLCFSKGLGCPIGAVLVGDKENIEKAIRIRKMLGGSMRQSGICAAACLYALDHNIQRLHEDHENATLLSNLLQDLESQDLKVVYSATNMVFIEISEKLQGKLQILALKKGLKMPSGSTLRLVTHLNITKNNISEAFSIIKECLKEI